MINLKWNVGSSYRFVIHEHKARRAGLHYDIRIMRSDGKMESFATRKNPFTIKPGQKRLLIRQPLHEREWLTMQGEIESGYGAGTLKIVDKGTVKIKKIDNYKDRVVVVLEFHGNHIKGDYALVQLDESNFLFVRKKNF